MNNIILNLSSGISDKENAPKLLAGTGEDKVHLCVVMTADRGLCGGFNSNIIKKAKSYFQKLSDSGKELKIITVGSKGYDQLKRAYKDNIIENISFKESKNANYFDADKVGKILIQKFEQKEFDVCTIFYNQFKNVITQIPQEQQIIPLKINEEEKSSDENYEFEPDEDEILGNLLPKNISTQIFKAMLENSASEQGSRMSAMDNATRNAGEMVDKLTIQYNRSRQAAITKELIEIISGAESL
jgi:F-type H+-transporting ATPase subunit gamma